ERSFQDTSGFVNRTDVVAGRTYNRFSWYGRPGALVEQLTAIVHFAPIWRYHDFGRWHGTIEDTLENFWIANLRGGWQAQVTLSLDHFGFEPTDYSGYTVGAVPFAVPHDLYHLPGAAFIVNTPNRAVSGSVVVGYSAAAVFPEASEGRQVAVTTVAALRPTPALRLEARWVHQRLTRARDGSRFSTANIPRLKLEYQLTRAIFVRYIGQYFADDQTAPLDPRTAQPPPANGAPAPAGGSSRSGWPCSLSSASRGSLPSRGSSSSVSPASSPASAMRCSVWDGAVSSPPGTHTPTSPLVPR